MSTTSVDATQNITPNASEYKASTPTKGLSKTLGQEEFFKILAAQLSSQDPLNPQKDTEFIAQMAQFNTLEQTKAMQADIAGLRAEQQLAQASGLLGKTVQVINTDHTAVWGAVTAVQMKEGTPKVEVNGKLYDANQVVSIVNQNTTRQLLNN